MNRLILFLALIPSLAFSQGAPIQRSYVTTNPAPVAVTNTFFVDLAGNNTTAVQGDQFRPYSTPGAAITATRTARVAGNTNKFLIQLGVGTWSIGTASLWPTNNTTISGISSNLTFIRATGEEHTNGPIIMWNTNVNISRLSLICDQPGGTVLDQSCLGVLSDSPNSNVLSTNYVQDCFMSAGAHGLQLNPANTNGQTVTRMFNCTISTSNGCAQTVTTNATMEFYSCYLYNTGPEPKNRGICQGLQINRGTAIAQNCVFDLQDGTNIDLTAAIVSGTSGSSYIRDCFIRVRATNSTATYGIYLHDQTGGMLTDSSGNIFDVIGNPLTDMSFPGPSIITADIDGEGDTSTTNPVVRLGYNRRADSGRLILYSTLGSIIGPTGYAVTNYSADVSAASNLMAAWGPHNTLTNLPAGTNGNTLTYDDTVVGGAKWASGGTVTNASGPAWLTWSGGGTGLLTASVNTNTANFAYVFGTNGFIGDSTGNSPVAGTIGQSVSSSVASASAVTLANSTASNITSISLTAGTWDVYGNVNFSTTTATTTGAIGGISVSSGTLPADGTEVYSGVQVTLISETDSVTLPKKRIGLGGTTTVYLVGQCNFSAGTVKGFGSISATRVH